nr:hypothetical protein [Tanacetum cinerariifolium]
SGRRRVQEAERHAVAPAFDRVVQQVRAIETFEVATARLWPGRPMAVDHAVVNEHVDQAERRHPGAHPLQGIVAVVTRNDQGNCHQSQRQQIEVIGFERAQMFFVMGLVQAPAPAVHDVLVGQKADTFHGDKGEEKNREVEDHSVGKADGSGRRGAAYRGHGKFPDSRLQRLLS